MAYIEVDVDLDEFDTQDLVDEIVKRLKHDISIRKKLTEKHIAALKESVTELSAALKIENVHVISAQSLDDVMKINHLNEVWNKYTVSDFESKLP